MKKIKYIAGIWFLFLLLSMVNCQSDEEFLKEIPKTSYTVENAFSTSGQVDQILVTIYSQLRDMWTAPGTVLRSYGSDLLDNSVASQSINNYGVTSALSPIFYNLFSDWYIVISRANLALHAAELPQISWASPADKTYAVAQARFFRALAYRNLAELFGGVPIVTEVITYPKLDFKRATRVETYQFAITELEAIENDLPETTVIGGRVVKGVAQHNLCELYLAMGTQLAVDGKASEASAAFAKSISFGNKVIDGGTYSLMNARFGTRKSSTSISINVYKGGVSTAPVDTVLQTTNYYWDLFQEGNVNYQDGNKESIWAMQIDYAAYKAEDKRSVLPYTRAFGPALRGNSQLMFQGTLEDLGGRGVRTSCLNMYSRDSVYQGKFGADMRNSDVVFRRRFKGNNPAKPYYLKIVPWDIIYNGGLTPQAKLNDRAYCYPVSCKISTDKFTGLADGQDMSNLFRDDYFIRLPETILLRAEAKQRSGDKVGAAADVNLLRARAKCSYMVTAADMDDNFKTILDERARELIYEECRWNTLLRMGGTIAFDRIKKYTYFDEVRAQITVVFNLFPIPQTVIDTNKDLPIEQNPGW